MWMFVDTFLFCICRALRSVGKSEGPSNRKEGESNQLFTHER